MKLVKTTFLGLALVAGLASCKKDDDGDSSSPKTKTDFLTQNDWNIKAATISPAFVNPITNETVTDFYSLMDACDKDDILKFAKDGVHTLDEGATKCDANDPQSETGTWEFQDSETKIKVTVDNETNVMTIEELISESLKISFSEDDLLGDGVTRTLTLSYEKAN